jgi:hypothetical protein
MRPKISMNSRAFAGVVALAAGIFASTLACVLSAQAADLPAAPRPAPQIPVAYAPPVYDWSGFYVGGHLGGGLRGSIRSQAAPTLSTKAAFSAAVRSALTRNSTGSCSASKAISAGPG